MTPFPASSSLRRGMPASSSLRRGMPVSSSLRRGMPARLNPFRSDCLHRLPFLPHPDAENTVLEALKANQWTGSIVGPHGSGKTTLILRLQEMMTADNIQTHYVQCQEDTPAPSSMDWGTMKKLVPRSVILLDGAELLSGRQLSRLRRLGQQSGGLIVTSHYILPAIPTVYATHPSANLLTDLIRRLHPDTLDDIEPDALYQRHNGNIRDALRELYDRCAGV